MKRLAADYNTTGSKAAATENFFLIPKIALKMHLGYVGLQTSPSVVLQHFPIYNWPRLSASIGQAGSSAKAA